MRSNAGFTLVEIMIVVSIVGLLCTIAIPSFMTSRATSQKQVCTENQRLMADMLDLYCLDNARAPLTSNFGGINAVSAALVPEANLNARYIANRKVFDCPSEGNGDCDDYALEINGELIIGFTCSIDETHNE